MFPGVPGLPGAADAGMGLPGTGDMSALGLPGTGNMAALHNAVLMSAMAGHYSGIPGAANTAFAMPGMGIYGGMVGIPGMAATAVPGMGGVASSASTGPAPALDITALATLAAGTQAGVPAESTVKNPEVKATPYDPRRKKKPAMCWHFEEMGVCQNGQECAFAHSQEELITGTNLYISNLPLDIKEEQCTQIFGVYGAISACKILPPTGTKSTRSALICFINPEEAEWVLKNVDRTTPLGLTENVNVLRAKKHAEVEKPAFGKASGKGSRSGPYGSAGKGGAGDNMAPMMEMMMGMMQSRGPDGQGMSPADMNTMMQMMATMQNTQGQKKNFGNRPPPNAKTELCRFFPQGTCKAGDACNYAHGEHELVIREKPVPAVKADHPMAAGKVKTAMCMFFQNGNCASGAQCEFAHYAHELADPTASLPAA
eukprot:gnl/TRDRNA2_/TRDRNA2_166977_c2_seq1.p1 gnl/TRDRNA2_/TRDRNA2_166977_c2~~gnl/TRDRNA2_/TRDRNA2_166977_c2_seq1.p1  ORF type:complete len:428 (+),score=57.75 gnl/TRDRNA2_/TRDRNA2_166977_c2_seq1:133-1416(+)